MELSEKLKVLRNALNLTQQQVADALGIQRSAYAYYEVGKSTPKLKILADIASIYNVTVDELLGRTEFAWEELRVMSSNPVIDNWTSNDRINQLSDFEQSVLIRLRLLPSEDKRKIIELIDQRFK